MTGLRHRKREEEKRHQWREEGGGDDGRVETAYKIYERKNTACVHHVKENNKTLLPSFPPF